MELFWEQTQEQPMILLFVIKIVKKSITLHQISTVVEQEQLQILKIQLVKKKIIEN